MSFSKILNAVQSTAVWLAKDFVAGTHQDRYSDSDSDTSSVDSLPSDMSKISKQRIRAERAKLNDELNRDSNEDGQLGNEMDFPDRDEESKGGYDKFTAKEEAIIKKAHERALAKVKRQFHDKFGSECELCESDCEQCKNQICYEEDSDYKDSIKGSKKSEKIGSNESGLFEDAKDESNAKQPDFAPNESIDSQKKALVESFKKSRELNSLNDRRDLLKKRRKFESEHSSQNGEEVIEIEQQAIIEAAESIIQSTRRRNPIIASKKQEKSSKLSEKNTVSFEQDKDDNKENNERETPDSTRVYNPTFPAAQFAFGDHDQKQKQDQPPLIPTLTPGNPFALPRPKPQEEKLTAAQLLEIQKQRLKAQFQNQQSTHEQLKAEEKKDN